MTEQEIRARIERGRAFINNFGRDSDEDYRTDQDLKKPQPPLTKAPMTDSALDLPRDFAALPIENDFLKLINGRASHRVYTEAGMTLLQLSYLLWCTQGVKSIRGKSYATLRTVPSGGARHPFECYLVCQGVDGLADGLYHYLPMRHQLEFLGDRDDRRDFVTASLSGQKWAAKAHVVFYYSFVFYRAEWRYGIWAHAPALIDSGHITENLYLACESIGLGGCAIAAVDADAANAGFGLDGVEESIFYAMPVGTIRPEDRPQEDAFYAFLKDEGL